ncbi:ribonuclease R [Hymenobacter profundi]|uniref:Ribonuclease R n=1 Tax=Hymenobacter profundi TaxID=1982110 RepID=A0ABS6WZJ2_9BACT|nr:ribonuclease R [Hymenobacter profundi]MBW3128991.1 ribonuclease R [Hymenobacter profundi]
MKRKDDSAAPRAPRAKAARTPQETSAPTASVTINQVAREFFTSNETLIPYRQLARRLGVTTKEQREVLFGHLRTLRETGQLELVGNDEYRLYGAESAEPVPATAPEVEASTEPTPEAAKGNKKSKYAATKQRQDEESKPTSEQSRPEEDDNDSVSKGRPVEAEFGKDPVIHRRREAGFDHAGDVRHQKKRRPERAAETERPGEYITGRVDLATQKFAFVVSEESEEDVRVFTDRLMFAMDGDTVRVRLRGQRDGRPVGDVVEILKREKDTVVGRLMTQNAGFGFVKPDYRKLYFDVFVPTDGLHEARDGEKVLVKITEWPEDPGRQPVGEVVRSFGQAGENEAEINAIMAEFGLPFEFPAEVEAESEAIPDVISAKEIKRRRDFRDVTTFTIDPADAKDFDDALSLRQLENGHWEVGVHIADVTHYVRPDTALEKEAEFRATSVYLVDRVIPMLPERLSNGLCSLRPNEDKLTFSAVFELDEKGKLYDAWYGKTIIHSDRRFAYEEAQERIETKEGDYATEVNLLNDIAKKLNEQRFKKGAISFETQEVKFRLDENGKPVGVYVKERKDAHKMIEEFMLLANRKVAEFVFKIKARKPRMTMVYRIHEAPDPDRLQNFALFAQKFGHTLDLTNPKKLSTELNDLSEEVVGKPEQNVIQTLAIRTMSKAIYSTEPIGHFGLAFEHYTHFTSPIRRYPDMMVHRLLEHYLEGGKNVPAEPVEEECKHSSEREKRAATAERASIKYKQVEYMADEIGAEFTGVVSGLTEWGVYVEIQENKCEGMVRVSDIPGDYFELDKDNYRLVGKKTKRVIQFGDPLQVVVKAANLLDRTIDFELVDGRPDAVKRREKDEKRGNRGGSRHGGGKENSGKGGGKRRR